MVFAFDPTARPVRIAHSNAGFAVMAGLTYALVTGASKGLGKFFSRALATRKHNLILVGRSKDKLEAVANELRNSNGNLAEPLELNLAAPGARLQIGRASC